MKCFDKNVSELIVAEERRLQEEQRFNDEARLREFQIAGRGDVSPQ